MKPLFTPQIAALPARFSAPDLAPSPTLPWVQTRRMFYHESNPEQYLVLSVDDDPVNQVAYMALPASLISHYPGPPSPFASIARVWQRLPLPPYISSI